MIYKILTQVSSKAAIIKWKDKRMGDLYKKFKQEYKQDRTTAKIKSKITVMIFIHCLCQRKKIITFLD